ncbi:MAG TPA: hypothetical protein ENI68_11280 [Gammaproteobacteria bacterium]|nr:hypothetical protein [Gammaproteobacteria bacterium]
MCGIAGAFNYTDDSQAESQVRGLLSNLLHRGHSHYEIGLGETWALGTNRLAIVDRDHGRQPMCSNDRKITGVLNGEIYNYHALRQELELAGYNFTTDTDTEVIANGYHYWSEALFERLDGMFAIILYDERTCRWVVARDPMGIKPMYYSYEGLRVLFSSEIKALIGRAGETGELPPGHYQVERQEPVAYFKPESVTVSDDLAENAHALRALISSAVRKRVQTDLPVAVLFSGGIDSSIILYEATQHHPDVTAFVIGREDAEDVCSAKWLCNELNIKYQHIEIPAPALLDSIPEVIRTIESFEPNHIRGGTLSYALSRSIAGAGFRIALCGEGADELFGGYQEFSQKYRAEGASQELRQMLKTFQVQLHRTQLQRVDRTAMRFTLEVRVPFLDTAVTNFASALPIDHLLRDSTTGDVISKLVLREAYRGILPDQIVDRHKAVLSYGAGFDSNGAEGIFYEHGRAQVTDSEFELLQRQYPAFALKSREEAYYFNIFVEVFGPLSLAAARPTVNATRMEAA